eukprot:6056965-Alexandrium_andersonii.AAC.1
MCIRDRGSQGGGRAIVLASAAIRLSPQSAMRKAQSRFNRSKLELCGPKRGLEIGPRSSRRG